MKTLFAIPPHLTFSDTLAEYLLDHYDTESLSALQLYLPTERSITAMRDALNAARERRGRASLMLPIMQPLGRIDEAQLLSDVWQDEALRVRYLALPDIIEKPAAELVLTQMIRSLARYLFQDDHEERAIEYDEAHRLAMRLLALYGECENEAIDIQKLQHISAEYDAQHWQLRAALLQQVTQQWRRYCEKEGCSLVEVRRRLVAEIRAEHWQTYGSENPIMIAGSTGTTVATANMIDVVAQMQNGVVVLPGYDVNATADAPEHQIFSHLFERLSEHTIASLTKDVAVDREPKNRFAIEAKDTQQEAQLAAMIVRDWLEDSASQIGIISADRSFNARLRQECERLNIVVDNPDGEALTDRPTGALLSHGVLIIAHPANIDAWLGVMHHPYFSPEALQVDWKGCAGELENVLMRGELNAPSRFNDLLYQAMRHEKLMQWEGALHYLQGMYESVASTPHQASDWVQQCRTFLQQCIAAQHEGMHGMEEALSWLETLEHALGGAPLSAEEWKRIALASMASIRVRKKVIAHPRVMLLSPQEARGQRFSHVLCVQLNEQVAPVFEKPHVSWLPPTAHGWLGIDTLRARDFALHDMACLIEPARCAGFLRSVKVNGTVQSPHLLWERYVDAEALQHRYAKHANAWLQSTAHENGPPIVPLEPKVDSALIPKELSPTGLELLRRNPYGFYAKYILKLKPRDSHVLSLQGAPFGTLMHRMFDRLTEWKHEDGFHYSTRALEKAAKKAGYMMGQNPATDRLWWPRIERVAEWWNAQDEARRAEGFTVEGEVEVEHALEAGGQPFSIKGRIDRQEVSGSINAITDYKTSTLPTDKLVLAGVALQLPVLRYASQNNEMALYYWECSGGKKVGKVKALKEGEAVSCEQTGQGVAAMLSHYVAGGAFICCPIEAYRPSYDAYAHLAREEEWRFAV